MRLTVNGEQKDVAAKHVDALLGELEFEGTHFAIAVNYDVVPRARWGETPLADGDTVEILTPRQGG
jgi:sulfur carrier protein